MENASHHRLWNNHFIVNNDWSSNKEEVSERGIELITHFEGFSPIAYKDTGGIWTIGFGTTIYPNGTSIKRGDTCTKEEAAIYIKNDLVKFQLDVLSLIKIPLEQNEFDALLSFRYNAGTSYKKNGVWTPYNIWKYINSKKITKEYWEGLAITVDGKKLDGLVRRRKAEATLYFDNVLNFE